MKASKLILAALFVVFGLGVTYKLASAANGAGGVKPMNFGICNSRRHLGINYVRFYNKQENRILWIYNNRLNSYQTMLNNFKQAGKNTDQFQSDINTLSDKINQLKSDIDQLPSLESNFQGMACTDQNWQQSWTTLLNQEKKIRQDRIDIEKFIRTVINPDIVALRNALTPTPSVTPTITPTPSV